VVRAEGFEPPRLATLEPKSSASTNSATPAKGIEKSPGAAIRQGFTRRGPSVQGATLRQPGGAAYIMQKQSGTIEMAVASRFCNPFRP
jgi:hypothetical protein